MSCSLFSGRMVVTLLLACSGFILVGTAETQWVALLGVVATSFSSGLGEATLLSYMPFFKNKYVPLTGVSPILDIKLLRLFLFTK